jgi:uncharacterized membrane protein
LDDLLMLALLVLGIPFLLPIGLWVSMVRVRRRISDLEREVEEQKVTIERLSERLVQVRKDLPAHAPVAPAGGAPRPPEPVGQQKPAAPVAPPRAAEPVAPKPPTGAVPPLTPRPSEAPPIAAPPRPPQAAPVPPPAHPRPPGTPPPVTPPPRPQVPVAQPTAAAAAPAQAARAATPPPGTPRPPMPPRPTAPPPPPPPSRQPFDIESLVPKLASAGAAIALVIGAVFFLRYSVQQGWLQPPIRVLIGIAVAIALLIVCELKAARKYAVTANALDAAAIAILFATFFAAHSLWNLIPALPTFALLGAVTALAVLLSVRRESLFIAVLGLLGGFATPALLSTGENRPIGLFGYLLLLNIGLAWVAYRQRWPVLTALTLVATTIYQWGWVFKFLGRSDLTLAMGIFLAFPIVGFAGLLLSRRPTLDDDDSMENEVFERTALAAALVPLAFVVYLAAVPAYGATPWLLFGVLALIDVGLLAIALARRQSILHAIGAAGTILVMATWIATSYRPELGLAALGFTALFVCVYLAAPAVAGWFKRPFEGVAEIAVYAAPILLFVPAALARIDPAFVAPQPLFGALLVLLLLCAWRAIAAAEGPVYFVASLFAVATQGVWSVTHLTVGRLGIAVAIYATFGVVSAAIPILARRLGRTLQPEGAAGATLLVSLGLLLFITQGRVAPEALWALALLLAILNAALFIESAASRLPIISQAASLVSWALLATWWYRAAGAVGVLPSLAVLTGLSILTLGGHAWASRTAAAAARSRTEPVAAAGRFSDGLYLGLVGHLFLFFIALNREWSLPPWPLFGTLAVLTLAIGATSLVVRAPALHAVGIVAAAVIVAAWTGAGAVAPWTTIGIAAAAIVSAYALLWIPIAGPSTRSTGAGRAGAIAAAGAAGALIVGEAAVMFATAAAEPPRFLFLLAAHAFNFTVLLALTATNRWSRLASVAVGLAWLALLQRHGLTPVLDWRELLMLTGTLYVIFTAYPLLAGSRMKAAREPWIVALVAAVMTFVAAREAFEAGGLDAYIGGVPVGLALVTAVLLRALLRLETPGARDMGRLALVAGVALAFVTVAIPLQLDHQWITIGWALEAAALAWLYTRIPHRGLLLAGAALFAAVFVRLALNPSIFEYEPRGEMRIFNWYLYTYLIAAVSMLVGAWWLSKTEDRITDFPRLSHILPAAAVILLFLLLNIEIADYYATGPQITFRFGVSVSQDLTYTIGWLVFGMLLLAAGISLHSRAGRITAVALIAITSLKCFLYDLSSLGGLYRVAAFVGLAISLSLVALALQKFVLAPERRGTA